MTAPLSSNPIPQTPLRLKIPGRLRFAQPAVHDPEGWRNFPQTQARIEANNFLRHKDVINLYLWRRLVEQNVLAADDEDYTKVTHPVPGDSPVCPETRRKLEEFHQILLPYVQNLIDNGQIDPSNLPTKPFQFSLEMRA